MRRIERTITSRLAAATFALALVFLLTGCWKSIPIPGTIEGNLGPREGATVEPLTELDGDGSYAKPLLNPDVSASPITALDDEVFPREPKESTVMIYMVGSDLECEAACASLDLMEMLGAGIDVSRTNVVVYTGGSYRWHVNIPNDRNCILEVQDGVGLLVAATDRSLNMGSKETLASFVSWATENYPSEHTALILWDHGGGPESGYGFDQLFQFDSLSLEEMQQAMAAAGYGPERKLDWVGFDACLMDSLETLQAWDDYAEYFVGSQEIEDGYGWDYTFLSAYNETSDAVEITTAVVDTFGRFYIDNPELNRTPSATLAAIDLASVPALEGALDTLSDAILEDFTAGQFSVFAQARELCRGFGAITGEASGRNVKLVDFVDLAERMADEHPSETQTVLGAVEGAVFANATNLTGAHGVSLYFPMTQTGGLVSPATAGFGRLLEEYNAQGQTAEEVDWTIPIISHDNEVISVGLQAGQKRSLSTASYTILADYEGRGYVPIVSNLRIEPNDDGTIELPADPEVIVVSSDESVPVPLTQIDADSTRQLYRCASASLLPGTEYVDAPHGAVDATLTLAVDGATGEVSVASASSTNTGGEAADGRLGLELEHYKTLMVSYGGWQYPERDDSGALLPYAQWDELGGNLIWSEVPLSNDLGFSTKHISELSGTYMLQVVLSDVNGTLHASELVPLASRDVATATVDTDEGRLSFTLADGHAILTGYRGNDACIEVPAEVEGLPVTELANDALSGSWSLREVVLPDTVTSIGSNALNCYNLERISLGSGLETIGNDTLCHCSHLTSLELPAGLRSIGRGSLSSLGVTELTLPASLEYLGDGALTRCTALTSYEVPEGCTAVQARDGVLLSPDGATIVAFPAGRDGSYEAPEGVTTIGYGAFASSALTSITLPEGLTTIDNCAFYSASFLETYALTEINLPDSLVSVGSYAFGSTYNGATFAEAPYIEELHLGSQLIYLGTNAFSGLRIGRFVVDEGNVLFSSPGGFIANKMGDTLVEAPSGMGQVVVVPDGVTTLGKDLFALYSPGTDIVLPASLSRISVLAFPYHYDGSTSSDSTRVYDIRLHCPADSPAAEFAERHNIAWDEQCDVAELTAHEALVEQGDLTLSFLVYPQHATLHAIDATRVDSGLSLVIPTEVEGAPVTAIDGLQQSRGLPTTWESVTLPATIASLDQEAIPLLRSEKGFVLEGENESFSVRDGVLFSADGRTLVAFALRDPDPFDRETLFSYEVPAGTRYIGVGAFNQSQLERIVMPSSLRQIQKGAFRGNLSLVDIQLNEGLQRIEARAFSCPATSIALPSTLTHLGDNALDLASYEGLTLPDGLKKLGDFVLYRRGESLALGADTLVVGRKLTSLGEKSLSSVGITAFEVDERNKSFSVVDGLLTSKNGRKLLRCPAGRTGELHIPAGIQHLEPGCLDEARGLTDVYFPSSVLGVDAYTSFGADSAARSVTFHCARDSEAARYAQAHGIAWTEEGVESAG